MKPWIRTALAVALMLAIAAGGFFLPNLVTARLDRADQDTAFSLSTVGHGSRTQRQEGGSLCIQCLYAAQKLRGGGGVCAEHADVRLILYLHDGHLLTKKVSAKRV